MATVNLGRIKPVFRGAYDNSTAYVIDDIVTSGGETFIAIAATQGNATSDGSKWTKLAAKGTDGTAGDSFSLANKEIAFKTNAGALDGIPIGTAGQILKVNSGATGYEFAADAGGNVLQIVCANGRTSDFGTSSTSLVQVTDSSISITPTSASSRVWVQWQVTTHASADHIFELHAYRGSTDIGNIFGSRNANSNSGYFDKTHLIGMVDHPNTTSATTYSLYGRKVSGSGTVYLHRCFVNDSDEPRIRMIAMEITASTQWSS